MIDGWFRTGDIGRVDPEGFLWIEGRVSDMINRGGLKVFPEEVAEVIRLSPDVAECAVAGIPDDRVGEVPWAFVVPREGATLDLDALTSLCREHLAPYKVAVLPLLKKRGEIVEMCHRIKDDLKRHMMAVYDDTAAIGKLYRRQDEIGTPWCITVDVDSLEDGAVTVRDRDSMAQERVPVEGVTRLILDRLEAAREEGTS